MFRNILLDISKRWPGTPQAPAKAANPPRAEACGFCEHTLQCGSVFCLPFCFHETRPIPVYVSPAWIYIQFRTMSVFLIGFSSLILLDNLHMSSYTLYEMLLLKANELRQMTMELAESRWQLLPARNQNQFLIRDKVENRK